MRIFLILVVIVLAIGYALRNMKISLRIGSSNIGVENVKKESGRTTNRPGGLGRHQAIPRRMELFRDDCVRKNLLTWQEKKEFAQNHHTWSKLIKWIPVPGKKPSDLGYEEFPLFVVGE